MKQRLLALGDKVEALQTREKILLLATLAVLVVLGWDSMLRLPQSKSIKTMRDRHAALLAEVQGYEVALQTLDAQEQRQGDPVAAARKDIERTQAEMQTLDQEIESLTSSGVVAPAEMAQALAQILKLNTRLRLLSLRNRKSEPLMAGAEPGRARAGTAADAAVPPAAAFVYRHSVELEFRGSYLDTLQYLQALERLPWRLIWNELEIRNETYPQARVRVVISTLSLQPGLLGV